MSEHTKGKANIETPIVKDSCGCLIIAVAKQAKGNKVNLSGFKIERCQLHKAAPDLLAACKLGVLTMMEQHNVLEAITKAIAKKGGISAPRIALPPVDILEAAIAKTKEGSNKCFLTKNK